MVTFPYKKHFATELIEVIVSLEVGFEGFVCPAPAGAPLCLHFLRDIHWHLISVEHGNIHHAVPISVTLHELPLQMLHVHFANRSHFCHCDHSTQWDKQARLPQGLNTNGIDDVDRVNFMLCSMKQFPFNSVFQVQRLWWWWHVGSIRAYLQVQGTWGS